MQATVAQTPPPPAACRSPKMFAEDMVRGYRIDIWDNVTKQWHSLCQRKATYDIADGAAMVDVPREEGTVRLAATTSPDEKSNEEIIWLHEAVLSWGGWSLCVPPPGKTIDHAVRPRLDENGDEVIVHEDPVGEPEAEVPPGSAPATALQGRCRERSPRLRYGRKILAARAGRRSRGKLAGIHDAKDFGPETAAR